MLKFLTLVPLISFTCPTPLVTPVFPPSFPTWFPHLSPLTPHYPTSLSSPYPTLHPSPPTSSLPHLTMKSINFLVYYQMEMMRNLRSVNIDHLHVGWYQSTYLGAFVSKNLLESQYSYQNSIAESVVLVYGE